MENYTPNSHKYKEEQKAIEERKKIEKVISGTAKVKKKSGAKKFTDVFLAEDVANVKTYIVSDVLIPAAKKLITDIVKDGIDMILYGGTRGPRDRSNGYRADVVSYNKYSDRRYDNNESRTRTPYSYDEIILPSRSAAEEVLDRMDELIKEYGQVAVADLYDLVGITGSYTDNKYGWTNLRNAEAIRDRDGYLLRLPKALPLSK